MKRERCQDVERDRKDRREREGKDRQYVARLEGHVIRDI